MLDLALNQSGAFRLVYLQKHIGNKENREYRIPMIPVIELPFTLTSRILATSAVYGKAPASWNVAGYLFQSVAGVNIDDSLTFEFGSGVTALDTSRRRLLINTTELHVFPRYATEHVYSFEPMRWIPEITLGVWEYIGSDADTTEELIQSVRVDLARIEQRIIAS